MEEEYWKLNEKSNEKPKEEMKSKENKTKNKRKKREKKPKKKMNKYLKTVLILFLVVIILLVVAAGKIIGTKLAKINFQNLNEADLGLNEDLYKDLGISKKDYDNIINIVLLGSDSKDMDDTYGGNSDAIMIISVNPKYKSIKLISIPRDTAANIEGEKKRYKINYAFAKGKEQLALKTINQNFDLSLKEYITINISSMYDIINELGGVELNITKEEMNWINQYIDMFYGFSGKPVQKVKNYGKVTLTGEQAAAHVKERMAGFSRKTAEHGDYGRTRRQRDVFTAMLNKIANKDPMEISKIIDMILAQVTTNVNVAKYTTKLPEFIANKDTYLNNVTSVMVPAVEYSKEIMENGAYIYVTDVEKAKKDFIKYMYQM